MDRETFTFEAVDEQATAALGTALAEVLPEGATVALCGTLGAGKTRLVQAIAAACGVGAREAVSPTFVLIQEYRGRRPVCHIDAYRIRDEEEFWALGPDEYFEGPGLTLVEWADRVPQCLPRELIEIQIAVTGAESRRFTVAAIGARYADTIERLEAVLRARRG